MANGGDTSPGNRILLVEGQDEMHVVRHVCESYALTPPFTISPIGGIDPLLRGIRSEISVEGRTAVGILVDANDDLQSRWQSVTDKLRAANIEPPSGPAMKAGDLDTCAENCERFVRWLRKLFEDEV